MINILSSGVDCGLKPQSCQTKEYKIASTLSMQHYRVRAKTWLARNQDNVSKWNDMSIYGLLF